MGYRQLKGCWLWYWFSKWASSSLVSSLYHVFTFSKEVSSNRQLSSLLTLVTRSSFLGRISKILPPFSSFSLSSDADFIAALTHFSLPRKDRICANADSRRTDSIAPLHTRSCLYFKYDRTNTHERRDKESSPLPVVDSLAGRNPLRFLWDSYSFLLAGKMLREESLLIHRMWPSQNPEHSLLLLSFVPWQQNEAVIRIEKEMVSCISKVRMLFCWISTYTT